MNYHPYPHVDRALAQLKRHRIPDPLLAWIDKAAAPLQLTEWQRAWLNTPMLANHPKRSGRAAITAAIADQAVKAGEHVHVAGLDGIRCAGGDPTCPAPRTAPKRPIVLARAIRTCTAVPSQWNAWTVDGQYLYLRYRSGIGTVDAYDDEDPEKWKRIPDGALAYFDTDDRHDGEMDLVEFCERTGLLLAGDAEVIGE